MNLKTLSLSFLVEQLGPNTARIRGKNAPSLVGPTRRQRQQGVQQQQSSLAPQTLGDLANCWVDSDAVTPVYRSQRGFANTAITRTSAGVYVLTLSDALSLTIDALLTMGVQHTTFASIAANLTSATTITTSTAVLAVAPTITATDLDYWLKVQQFGPQ